MKKRIIILIMSIIMVSAVVLSACKRVENDAGADPEKETPAPTATAVPDMQPTHMTYEVARAYFEEKYSDRSLSHADYLEKISDETKTISDEISAIYSEIIAKLKATYDESDFFNDRYDSYESYAEEMVAPFEKYYNDLMNNINDTEGYFPIIGAITTGGNAGADVELTFKYVRTYNALTDISDMRDFLLN